MQAIIKSSNTLSGKSSNKNTLNSEAGSFVQLLIKWSWIILLICAVAQCAIFWSDANCYAVLSVLLAWLFTTKIFLRPKVLNNFPLSVFLIIGFSVTHFYLPIVATLVESKPLIYNLVLPEQVFTHSLLSFLVLIVCHAVYRFVFNHPARTLQFAFEKIGIFEPPKDFQVWLMGFVGLAATCYSFIFSQSGKSATGSAADKLFESLIPFTYAPFFIPFSSLYGNVQKHSKKTVVNLALFTVLLFVISIARNSRGSFMFGFATVGFAYGLGLLLGRYKTRLLTAKNVFLAAIVFWLFTGPISDLGVAMTMVRGERNNISSSELFNQTLKAFNDKNAIRLYKLDMLDVEIDWDEDYLDNIFLARFCNLKFNDASLIDASAVGYNNPDLLKYTTDRFWTVLPDPILRLLGLSVDKDKVNSVSFGDYLHYTATGDPEILGSLVTSHLSGSGMAAFGWWYLFILAIGMFPIFFLFDTFVLKKSSAGSVLSRSKFTVLHFSLCGLLDLTSIFQFMLSESVVVIGNFMVRGWIQMIFLYVLLFHFTRFLSGSRK